MTAASFVRDLAAFSIQIAIVVVVVAGLLRLVRMPARARYICLRLTLLGCLVVPWTLRSVVVVTEAPAGAAAHAMSESPASAASPEAEAAAMTPPTRHTEQTGTRPGLPWTRIGVVALLVGVAARVIWLALGFFRLGQLTRRAVPIESLEYATVQEQLGTAAAISEVDGLAQPVTFGFRRPVVLLPDSLADAPASLRRAVVTHELFHVRRSDWLSLLGEEAVRTVLWFHPAIHWLTSSIQLAREEIVDELTVRATGDRRAYMQALLAFADTGGLRAAPAFAHRRQLFHRIVSVSKEKVMSAPRIVMSVAALALGVSAASWYASSAFPILTASRIELPAVTVAPMDDGWLIAEPQFVTVAAALRRGQASGDPLEPNEVTPDNPIPRRTRGASPPYPQVTGAQPEVAVNALVRIARDGTVTNVFDKGCSVHVGARLLDRQQASDGACRRFFDATATAIREWRYERPVRGPLQFGVVVTFQPGTETAVVQAPAQWASYVSQAEFEQNLRDIRELERERDRRANEDILRTVMEKLLELERAQALTRELGPSHPDRLAVQAQLARVNDQLAQLQRELERTRVGSSQLSQAAAELARAEAAVRAARAAQEAARDAQKELVAPSGRAPVRIRDNPAVKAPTVTKSVKPEHPVVAMQARVTGTVVLEVLVDEQGRVADARVVKSIPLLDRAALDAAKQWEFTPTVVNGEAVPVLVMLEMNFALK